MKVSDMKAQLKKCKVSVSVRRSSAGTYDVFKAGLYVSRPEHMYDGETEQRWETFIAADFQANDIFHANNVGEKPAPQHSLINLAGVGHWYAGEIECKVRFGGRGGSYGYNDPARATTFFEVVGAVITKYNLSHKYPNCELSQTLEALEKLGCRIEWDVVVDRQDKSDWNRNRWNNAPKRD
jgi:hypothetical protein